MAEPQAKRLRTSTFETMGSLLDLLQVQEINRNVLSYLDFDSIDSLLVFLHVTRNPILLDHVFWKDQLVQHFGGPLPEYLQHMTYIEQPRPWMSYDQAGICNELHQFLRSGDERSCFNATFQVIKGNLAKIQVIDDQPIDGIAFPTASHLMNPRIGSAGAVFGRAGYELVEYLKQPEYRRPRQRSDVVVTPGFNAGVRRLLHCIGPSIWRPECYELLRDTYANIVNRAMDEELECIAMTSISTGSLGVPAIASAHVGLRTMQNSVRATQWTGKIGVVCIDDTVFNAFSQAKEEILRSFNVIPPLPQSEQDDNMEVRVRPALQAVFGA